MRRTVPIDMVGSARADVSDMFVIEVVVNMADGRGFLGQCEVAKPRRGNPQSPTPSSTASSTMLTASNSRVCPCAKQSPKRLTEHPKPDTLKPALMG
jgi:hypothetical protein